MSLFLLVQKDTADHNLDLASIFRVLPAKAPEVEV